MELNKTWKKQVVFVNTLVVFFFIIDRVLKQIALSGAVKKIFFLSFSVSTNLNIAFSIPIRGIFFYILLIIIFAIVVFYLIKSYQKRNIIAVCGLSLIFIGALSNVLDRLKYGFVIDYVNVPFLFTFNVADVIIIGGVFILALFFIRTFRFT